MQFHNCVITAAITEFDFTESAIKMEILQKKCIVLVLVRGSVGRTELEFPAVYIFTEGSLTGILFTDYHANLPTSGPGSKLYPWPQSF